MATSRLSYHDRWVAVVVFLVFLQFDIEPSRPNYVLLLAPVVLAIAAVGPLLRYPIRSDSRVLLIAGVVIALPWALINPGHSLVRLGIVVMGGSAGLLAFSVWSRAADPAGVLRRVIWLNIAGLLVQWGGFVLSGSVLDLHRTFLPFSRVSETDAIHGFGLHRFNGFQLEPGTYSVMVGLLLLLSLALERRTDRVHVVGVVSLIATRSGGGIAFAAIVVAVALALSLRRATTRRLFAVFFTCLSACALALASGLLAYVQGRIAAANSGADGSVRLKGNTLNFWWESSAERKLFGSGLFINDCAECAFINANGVAFMLVFYLGLLGFLVSVALLIRGLLTLPTGFALAVALLTSRLTLYQPTLWFVLMALTGGGIIAARRNLSATSDLSG